jgi:hypothetical protein
VLVCEPTRRGVGVYRQYAELAAGHGVALRVLGNKVGEPADVDYLRDQVGDALLGRLVQSPWVRAAERGAPAPIGALEPANLAVLGILLAELDSRTRDWVAYHRGTVEFHLRNAAAWANEAVGADLARQVAPDLQAAEECSKAGGGAGGIPGRHCLHDVFRVERPREGSARTRLPRPCPVNHDRDLRAEIALPALSADSSTPGTRAVLRLGRSNLDHESHRP